MPKQGPLESRGAPLACRDRGPKEWVFSSSIRVKLLPGGCRVSQAGEFARMLRGRWEMLDATKAEHKKICVAINKQLTGDTQPLPKGLTTPRLAFPPLDLYCYAADRGIFKSPVAT